VIDYLINTTYRSAGLRESGSIGKVKNIIEKVGIEKGLNNFVKNFDNIFAVLAGISEFRTGSKRKSLVALQTLVATNRDCLFCNYIPLINKIMLITEKTDFKTYVDKLVAKAIDVKNIMASMDRDYLGKTVRSRENRTAKALSLLADYYEGLFADNISGKEGQFRKHISGSRSFFSFRTVITSITRPHVYDEIYVPWYVGLTTFRPHLLNKLLKMGYSHNNAIGMLAASINKHNEVLETLLNELIEECPYKGIPVTLNRNQIGFLH
jgi:hypothetical protein